MGGAVLSTFILVAGCGGEASNGEPTGADTTSSVSSTRTTPSKTTTTAAERTPETDTAVQQAPSAANPAVAGPTLVECIYGGGAWTESGWLSDGSHGYHPKCAALRSEQMAKNPYRCPQTDYYVSDLSECANPNGIPVPPEVQNPPAVDTPSETLEPVEPPVEPETEEAPLTDRCEAGDTAEACQ